MVRNIRTEEKGIAPKILLVDCAKHSKPGRPEHQSYFFPNLDKRSADLLLLRPSVPTGTFIIRPSNETGILNSLALIVRAGTIKGIPSLSKFRIHYLSDGLGFVFSPPHTFEDIVQFIEHYRSQLLFFVLINFFFIY